MNHTTLKLRMTSNIKKLGLSLFLATVCCFSLNAMNFEDEINLLNNWIISARTVRANDIALNKPKEEIELIDKLIQEKTKKIDDILWPKRVKPIGKAEIDLGVKVKEINQEIIDSQTMGHLNNLPKLREQLREERQKAYDYRRRNKLL